VWLKGNVATAGAYGNVALFAAIGEHCLRGIPMMKKNLLLLSLLLPASVASSAQTVLQQFTSLSQGSVHRSFIELKQPTRKGSVLIAIPMFVAPNIRVLKVSDDGPEGGSVYHKIEAAAASCANKFVDIWYCENCKAGVTEIKMELSDTAQGLNSFLEVADLAPSAAIDGPGAHVSDGTATIAGQAPGASITTSAQDFVLAAYFPPAAGITPASWAFTRSFAYLQSAPPGTYQPTLTGAKPGNYCMAMAAFKAATTASAPK
jgi:hypothetical protein